MRPVAAPGSTSTSPAPAALLSPWRSPVPYLFGGLAAMLGLIALALLILACSYWKLNNYLGTGHASASDGAAAGDGGAGEDAKSPPPAAPAIFAELVAVVMAGDKMPSFLAAPIGRRAAAFEAGDGGKQPEEEEKNSGKAGEESGTVTAPGSDRNQELGV